MQKTQQFARLFMAPGMWHCKTAWPQRLRRRDPAVAARYTAIRPAERPVQWVEKGVAPNSVIATKYTRTRPGRIDLQRPLCPYRSLQNMMARKSETPASFACVTDK